MTRTPDPRNLDQRCFAALLFAVAACIAGLAGLVVHLLRIDAPSHVLGLIKQLCTTASHVTMDFGSLLLAAVPIGIGALIVVHAAGTHRRTSQIVRALETQRICLSPRVAACARRAGLTGRVSLIECPDPLVFASGYRRTRVIITTAASDALADDELAAVMCHEAHHVRRRDPLRILVAEVAARSFVLFPVIGELRDRFAMASEIAADRHAIERTHRHSLIRALLKLMDAPEVVGVPAMASHAHSPERLAHLLDPWREVGSPYPSIASVTGTCTRAGVIAASAWLLTHLPAM